MTRLLVLPLHGWTGQIKSYKFRRFGLRTPDTICFPRAMNKKIVLLISLLIYSSISIGQEWIKDADTSCKVWNQSPFSSEYIKWQGACKNGLANGEGVVLWFLNEKANGKFEGKFIDGKLVDGVMINAKGEHNYVGESRSRPSTNLVVNGDFESGLEGWIVSSPSSSIRVDQMFGSTSGSSALALSSAAKFEQSIPTELGKMYKVEFDWKPAVPESNGIQLNIEGVERKLLQNQGISRIDNNPWDKDSPLFTRLSVRFVADGPSTVLRFKGQITKTDSVGQIIDNITVTEVNEMQASSSWKVFDQRTKTYCLNAVVPNSAPQPNESTTFYGKCDSKGVAVNGIVVRKHKDYPVAISCLNKSEYTSNSRTDQFEACQQYWSLLPNFCHIGTYFGQCKDGVAHGIGFESGSGDTVYLKSGQFENGKLHGRGYSISVSGCGMAGCSGNRLSDKGWFIDGKKEIDCDAYIDCIERLSGRQLAIEKRRWKGSLSELDDLRRKSTFDSILEAYNISREKTDLRQLFELAKTPQQKAKLEYEFIQTAGFNKSFLVSGRIKNGRKSFDINDKDHLLGMFHAVDSRVPIVFDWGLKPDHSLVTLKDGVYEVSLSIGVNVKKTARTTLLGFAQSHDDIDRYVRNVTFEISKKNNYSNFGTVNLSVSGDGTSAFLGIESGETITGIEPVIMIESIKLKL